MQNKGLRIVIDTNLWITIFFKLPSNFFPSIFFLWAMAIIFAQNTKEEMSYPAKIKPAKKQVSMFIVHVLVFAVVTAIMWYLHFKAEADSGHWVYPWQAWITAAWGLGLIGHWCALYTSTEDPGMDEFQRQAAN